MNLVQISSDRLTASLVLPKRSADEPLIGRDEVDAAMAEAGVVHGLDQTSVEEAWLAHEAGTGTGEPLCIARGTAPTPGREARLEYCVELERTPGTATEGGERMDFRERNTIINVEVGELIGTWWPSEAGQPGRGVDGIEIEAEAGGDDSMGELENVECLDREDDGFDLIALIDGMLEVQPQTSIRVIDLLKISGDIDLESGNVEASGSVVVDGAITTGSSVRARHDVTVVGTIERATVEAGGALSVGGGIIGGPGCKVSAGDTLSTGFAHNARVSCDGDVELRDAGLSSTIDCRGRLDATGGKGRLRGGSYTAMRGLAVRELGSELGAETIVRVGSDPALIRELDSVRLAIKNARSKSIKLQRSMKSGHSKRIQSGVTSEHGSKIRRIMKARRELSGTEDQLKRRLRELEAGQDKGEVPTVEVLEVLHGGVVIHILDATYTVERRGSRVRLSYDAETRQIKLEPL